MRSITARTSTDTGHFSTQPGLGHSMQRSDSCRACSIGKPRFTSRKLWARTSGFCSGTRCRGSFTRSLFGSGLLLGTLLLIEYPRLNGGAFAAYRHTLSQTSQLAFRIGLQPLDAGTLLLAIHVVALRQDLKVDLGGIELGPVHAGELAGVVHQNAAAAAHPSTVHHDGIQTDNGLDQIGRASCRARV